MGRLVIRNAVLHDGAGTSPVDKAALVVEDGRIVYAGPESSAPALPGALVVDASGKHLIPGLIDCHVHLSLSGGPDFMIESTCSQEEGVERGIANVRAHLEAGVTAVRDLGGVEDSSFRVLSLVERGDIPGPRIVTAGRVLTVRGGHAHTLGIEADTGDELASAIDSLADAGAGVIKIVTTGGVLTVGVDAQSAKYSVETLRAGVRAAHARGLRVAAHAIGADGIDRSLQAGVDSVEHGCYLTDLALGLLAGGSQWLVATLSAPVNILRGGDVVPDYARAKSIEVGTDHKASFHRAADAGANIATGTDAGTPFNPHGGLAGEMQLLHENGLDLARLLVAATSAGARLIGLDDVGVLREGFVADAVLLDGDPLQSVDAYRRVSAVVQAGRVL